MRTRSPARIVSGKCIGTPDCPAEGRALPVCTECQRRKQRCTRRWPCYHCQKRKIADQCRFMRPYAADGTSRLANKKRSHACDQDALSTSSEWEDFDDFKIIGYMEPEIFCSIPSANNNKGALAPNLYRRTAESCPQLLHALQLLHSRTTTDILMQNYLAYFDFHSFIVHPPSFLEQYCDWWADRRANKALVLPWTCLLLTVCALSMQHTKHQLPYRHETEVDEQPETSDKYHRAALELHDVIPIRDRDISSVQVLMHSCLWYRCEARFVQSWHALNIAIRLAQELRIDRNKVAITLSEFDFEMRRRLWCLLDNWDWQISSLLSRPPIIDRFACGIDQPSLALEGHLISPLLHVKIQSLMIGRLSRRFDMTDNSMRPCLIKEYLEMVQEWMDSFPPQLDAHNPDTSFDLKHEWIPIHRAILECAGYQMMLRPFRPYLCRSMNLQSPQFELQLRAQGVDYGLRFLHSLIALLNRICPGDISLQPMLYSLFDVSITLCSTIIYDGDGGLHRRNDIWNAVQESAAVLTKQAHSTWTAQELLNIIARTTHCLNVASEMPSYWSMTQP